MEIKAFDEAHTFNAYTVNFVEVKATPVPGTKMHLMFIDQEKGVLFNCHLELEGCHRMAEACAETIAASNWMDLWVKVPNPNANQE